MSASLSPVSKLGQPVAIRSPYIAQPKRGPSATRRPKITRSLTTPGDVKAHSQIYLIPERRSAASSMGLQKGYPVYLKPWAIGVPNVPQNSRSRRCLNVRDLALSMWKAQPPTKKMFGSLAQSSSRQQLKKARAAGLVAYEPKPKRHSLWLMRVIGETPLGRSLAHVATSLVREGLCTQYLIPDHSLANGSTPPTPQMGRRKLDLLPRSGNVSASPSPLSSPKMGPTPPASSRSNPFGAARCDIAVIVHSETLSTYCPDPLT